MNSTSDSHQNRSRVRPLTGEVTSRDSWPRRPSVNISPAERAGRIVLGVVAVITGSVLLVSAATVLAVVLEVLLVAAGLALVITGWLGHCPLYARLGHVPASIRRSR